MRPMEVSYDTRRPKTSQCHAWLLSMHSLWQLADELQTMPGEAFVDIMSPANSAAQDWDWGSWP